MAHRPRNVPPAIDAKWTEMRRKHEEETNDWMLIVEKNRTEFEGRVLQAKKRLLAKHQQEEQLFWSDNGPGSRISMTPAPAASNGQVQTPRRTQGTATPVRGTPISSKKSAPSKTSAPVKASVPVKKATSAKTSVPVRRPMPLPGPAPALPRMEVAPVQEPVRPVKPLAWKKDANNDIIILSSDDEEDPVLVKTKPVVPRKTPVISKPANINTAQQLRTPVTPTKTPLATKPMLTNKVQQLETSRESMDEDSTSSDYSNNNFASTLPEATLEFFGGFSRAPIAPPMRSSVKEESVQPRSPNVLSRTPLPSTQSQKTFHGLPELATPSPYQARDPPATPPFAPSGRFTPFTPPTTPGFGSWNGGFNAPASSFSPQAIGTRQEPQRQASFGSSSPFAKQMLFGHANAGPGSPFQSFSGPAVGAASPASPFGMQNSSSSNVGTSSLEADLLGQSVKKYVSLANEQGGHSRREVQKDPALAATSDGAQQMSVDVPTHGIINTGSASKTSADVVETKTVNVDNHGQSIPPEDVCMLDTAQVSSKGMASSPNTPILPDQQQGYLEARPSIECPQTPIRQLPSPPPSHASVVSEQIKSTNTHVKTPVSAFKLPTAPASAAAQARHSVAPEARNIRAGTVDSRASSFTLPAQSRSERGLSVASRTSRDSARTGVSHTRKRPMEYSLSDDDEDISDYAPSEPESPLAGRPAIGARDGPVVKKSKITTGVSRTTQFDKNKAKNGYGFMKPVVTPKPKPAASVASSGTFVRKPSAAPSTAPRKPVPAGVTVARKGSTFTKAKPTNAKSNLKKKQFVPQPSRRRAAMNAESKIQDMYDDAEEFATEQAIEDADQLEDARLPDTFRDMSLTPAPFDGDESVEMLMERDTAASPTHSPKTTLTAAPAMKKNYDFPAWTQDRANGDRHMAKKLGGRFQMTVQDEEDEEADISGVEELDLTGDEQTMRRGDGGGEGARGMWERIKGAVGGYRMSLSKA